MISMRFHLFHIEYKQSIFPKIKDTQDIDI